MSSTPGKKNSWQNIDIYLPYSITTDYEKNKTVYDQAYDDAWAAYKALLAKQTAYEQANEAVVDAESKLESAEANINTRNNSLGRANRALSLAESAVSSAQSDLNTKEAAAEKAASAAEGADRRRETARTTMQNAEANVTEQEGKVSAAEKTRAERTEKVNALTNGLYAAKESANTAYQNAVEERKAAEQTAETATDRVTSAKEAAKAATQTLHEKEDALAKANKAAETARKDLAEAERAFSDRENYYNLVKKNFDNYTAALAKKADADKVVEEKTKAYNDAVKVREDADALVQVREKALNAAKEKLARANSLSYESLYQTPTTDSDFLQLNDRITAVKQAEEAVKAASENVTAKAKALEEAKGVQTEANEAYITALAYEANAQKIFDDLKPKYSFTDGTSQSKNGTYVKGSNQSFLIATDGNYDWFESLMIDGVSVDPSNYEKKEGSTELYLKPEFMDTLSAGTHTATFVYDHEIEVSGTFTVEDAKKAETTESTTATKQTSSAAVGTSPKTGDTDSAPAGLFAGFFAGLAGLGVALKRRKRV